MRKVLLQYDHSQLQHKNTVYLSPLTSQQLLQQLILKVLLLHLCYNFSPDINLISIVLLIGSLPLQAKLHLQVLRIAMVSTKELHRVYWFLDFIIIQLEQSQSQDGPGRSVAQVQKSLKVPSVQENNDSKLVKGRPEAGESKWVLGRVIRGSVDFVCFIQSQSYSGIPCNSLDS